MSERISALMDGELADDATTHELTVLRGSGESRDTWDTYHLIGDVLRGDISPSIARRVSEQLAVEPTVLAPKPIVESAHHSHMRYALSAAAGLAGVALVIWTATPVLNPTQSQMAAVRAVPADSGVVDKKKVENYLFAHQPSSAMQAPHIHLVTVEGPAR